MVSSSFKGCDIVSSFHGKSKKSAWNTWDVCDEVSNTFATLSECTSAVKDSDLHALEKCVVLMYDRSSDVTTLNEARSIVKSCWELTINVGAPRQCTGRCKCFRYGLSLLYVVAPARTCLYVSFARVIPCLLCVFRYRPMARLPLTIIYLILFLSVMVPLLCLPKPLLHQSVLLIIYLGALSTTMLMFSSCFSPHPIKDKKLSPN